MHYQQKPPYKCEIRLGEIYWQIHSCELFHCVCSITQEISLDFNKICSYQGELLLLLIDNAIELKEETSQGCWCNVN